MEYINPKSWVNAHKREFANNLIKKSKVQPHSPKTAVFMAGLPGAGKTEFTKNLIRLSNLEVIRLDMDEIATYIEGYEPAQADKYRAGASALLNKTYDLVLKKGLDFIMDGTFGSKNAVFDVNRALSHDYQVKIIYLYQDPKIAWHFTREREKVEHRAIEEEGFINVYFNTLENVKAIKKENGDKIVLDLVIKDKDNEIGSNKNNITEEEIDKIQGYCYNKKSLKEYIND